MENTAKINNPDSKQPVRYSFDRKQILIAILIVVLLITFLWIWKIVQIKSIKNEYNKREQVLVQNSNMQIEKANRHFLELIAKPYVWAVRTELMQGNINQINLYGADIVKEKNLVSVMVANEKGLIISSTDKKYEGKDLKAVNLPNDLIRDSTFVDKINESLFVMTSPIMSFNSKLGTLIINYATKGSDTLKMP